MNSRLLNVALVLLIVALVLWIGFELVPNASQEVGTTVQEIREESAEDRAIRESISLVRNDSGTAQLLSSLGSTGNESYSVTETGEDGSMSVEINYTDSSGISHTLTTFTFQGKVVKLYQLDGAEAVFY